MAHGLELLDLQTRSDFVPRMVELGRAADKTRDERRHSAKREAKLGHIREAALRGRVLCQRQRAEGEGALY